MNVSKFTKEELKEYFNAGKTYFFTYNFCYILNQDDRKCFYFSIDKARTKRDGLPHTKKGRFVAFNENDSYVVSTSLTPPNKIKISKYLNRKIINNNLKAVDLVSYLKMYGFSSKKENEKTSLSDLNFKGAIIKKVAIKNNFIEITY